ncbi:alpha/beta hydrolase [Halobacillus locisalis]|uniref:Alpha/beta hydrolase n=1 Tax=Halobacillus locisalis TaxID=220753 RepID=A0A838CV35_9BACI|nr:alpha/beta hydrolase [Halobacillus locisalis]MBA2175804.1 alpha/beta hydrolase [Halobacillus locisalis]
MQKWVAQPSKATIVIVHGAFEHGGRYEALAKQFQADGFSVIHGDLPGQGHTVGKAGHIRSFDQYISTVEAWLQEAGTEQPVFLLGHSMGGTIVMRTMETLKPEVSGVILSSPAAGILNGAGKPLEAVSRVLDKVMPTLRVKSPMKPEMVTRNQDMIEKDLQDTLILDKVSVRWYHEFRRAIKAAFKDVSEFPNVPLLVMQAEEDQMVDVDKTKEWFNLVDTSEKNYKQWPSLYHEIYNEPEWKDVYQYTLDFINRQL